jgi:hypothetical protein
MAKSLQLRGGTSVEHETFIGAPREVTVVTDTNALRVHDGVTAGGHEVSGSGGDVILDDANVEITALLENSEGTTLEQVLTDFDLLFDEKQNKLVSGTNIKTVNGETILGSGNVAIPHATASTYGTIKAYVSGTTLYITL